MICQTCAFGADVATDYRTADTAWREEHPDNHTPAAGMNWLTVRLRYAAVMHRSCRGGTWCDCQHLIPELKT